LNDGSALLLLLSFNADAMVESKVSSTSFASFANDTDEVCASLQRLKATFLLVAYETSADVQ
jgi:hypothetical protein